MSKGGWLPHLFQRGSAPVCEKAADANDDGKLNISGAVRILLYLFAGQGPLPDPIFRCGRDPTEDRLGCGELAACGG
jgi:hypothetical protein